MKRRLLVGRGTSKVVWSRGLLVFVLSTPTSNALWTFASDSSRAGLFTRNLLFVDAHDDNEPVEHLLTNPRYINDFRSVATNWVAIALGPRLVRWRS